jgi:hypothetical protein
MKPTWDGTTPFANFNVQVRGYLVEKGVDIKDDSKTLPLLPLLLSGDALSLVAGWEDDARRTFQSAMEAIKKWYMERTRPTEPLLTFSSRIWRPDETMDSFVSDLKRLIEYVSSAKDTKKELLLSQFLAGVPSEAKPFLKAFNISKKPTFEQLVEYAISLDIRPPQFPNVAVSSEVQSNITAAAASKSPTSKASCYRCGAQGHIATSCHISRDIRCNSCNKVGHIRRACRTSPALLHQGKAQRW